MSFALSVAEYVEDTTEETAALHKAIVLELFISVILDTPVLEGRLRGNWIISSGEPETGTVDVTDPTGEKTTVEVQKFVSGIDFKSDVELFLANNLPYAYRIEYDGWSHTKAPAGMVRKNIARIVAELEAR